LATAGHRRDEGAATLLRHLCRSIQCALLIAAALAATPQLAASGELQACFTPGEDCTTLIVRQIDGAKSELLVQAYGLTSAPIIQALGRAKERGVDAKVILDRINEQKRYTAATYLKNHGIDVLIDDAVVIAHNKVMVIDRRNVITGSFNFTRAAHAKNAENVLLITDDLVLAKAYAANWERRATAARRYVDFRSQ
jgi:phosphatidylserine/phosphatidylglycerophosphate/cardiolipin synthase-like enzyme